MQTKEGMEIKEGIVLERISAGMFIAKVDNEEVVCIMSSMLIRSYFQVIVGDKIYVKGVRYVEEGEVIELRALIMEPRERMSYHLPWSMNHSPISPEEYESRFKKEEDS
ncbi:MAG: hypothetical protein AB8B69_11950 [Chitinophagales bacterium]